MKWNHLPEPGGLYAQHPVLLDQFMHIFNKRAEYQEKERQKEMQERQRKSGTPGKPVAGRRRR